MFSRGSGSVVVLVPVSQDWDRHDGTQADRAIAVHTQGVDELVAEEVVAELTAAVRARRQADEVAAAERRTHALAVDPEPVDLRQLLVLTVDGRATPVAPGHITGAKLVASVLDRSQWPSGVNVPPDVMVMAFTTKRLDFVGLEADVDRREGQQTVLGQMPSFVAASDQSVEVEMAESSYYDVFLVARLQDGTGRIIGWVRLATTPPADELPFMISLEEAKAAALLFIGVPFEQAQQVTATITALGAWGAGGRLAMVGFDFGPPSDGDMTMKFGVMVDHMGGTDAYHGYSAPQMREHLEV